MRLLLLLSPVFFAWNTIAQTLNLPPRNASAQNGDQVIASIETLNLVDRENYILNEVLTGNVPDFLRSMIQVNDSALIGGSYKHITYYCIPDYLALGTDTNYFLCPMTPILGQRIADSLDCILPTRKMVNQIWSAASVKMQPESIPPSPDMTTVPVFATHDSMVWTQRQNFFPGLPLGEGVSGDKKDVVISNLIYSSPPPNRVVIYGWHYPSGSNIQPLYAGHIDTYADYSHGIRLVQNAAYVDGVLTLASDVLMSGTDYGLLSDEGIIAQPYYPDTSTVSGTTIPAVPSAFLVTLDGATTLQVNVQYDPNVSDYLVETSSDGLSFVSAGSFATNNFVLNGLTGDQITYVRLAAQNSAGTSGWSEVLAGVPSANAHTTIIINGFDRLSAGNTNNFIRQHGTAIVQYGYPFSSATNEAMANGMISLPDFEIVDYILGEESTADETFSTSEQNLLKNYLNGGGFLFVSGAEIGWDLDYLGSAQDQDFYQNYLKSSYVYDAPNDQSSTYYQFEALPSGIFTNSGSVYFDDGTNGTYNVGYPDVINAVNGGIVGLKYSGLTDNFASVYFKGLFPLGLDTGKVVTLGFPFETIYPETDRNQLMTDVLDFFSESGSTVFMETTEGLHDIVVYPNPNSGQQIHVVYSATGEPVTFTLCNLSGKVVLQDKCEIASGEVNYSLKNSELLPPACYILNISSGEFRSVKRIVKL